MKASIIIPAYNEAESIATCVKAALAQDYQDKEVIVIDNASKDATGDIARSLGVKVLREEKKGTMAACECGRRAATGDVIVRLDADCEPDPTWLSRGMVYFQNSRVVGLTGPYHYFDANFWYRSSFFLVQAFYKVVNTLLRWTRLGGIMVGGNSFMRASSLNQIGGFDTSIEFYGDDTDVAKRLARLGLVVFDIRLAIKSSARRFARQGVAKTGWLYTAYFFKVILSGGKKQK